MLISSEWLAFLWCEQLFVRAKFESGTSEIAERSFSDSNRFSFYDVQKNIFWIALSAARTIFFPLLFHHHEYTQNTNLLKCHSEMRRKRQSHFHYYFGCLRNKSAVNYLNSVRDWHKVNDVKCISKHYSCPSIETIWQSNKSAKLIGDSSVCVCVCVLCISKRNQLNRVWYEIIRQFYSFQLVWNQVKYMIGITCKRLETLNQEHWTNKNLSKSNEECFRNKKISLWQNSQSNSERKIEKKKPHCAIKSWMKEI